MKPAGGVTAWAGKNIEPLEDSVVFVGKLN